MKRADSADLTLMGGGTPAKRTASGEPTEYLITTSNAAENL